MTRESQRGFRISAISASTLSLGLRALPRARRACELGQLAAGLGQGLVEAGGLLVVQVLRVGDDDAPLGAEDDLGGLEGGEAGEAALVDGPVAALGDGEQVGVVRRWQRADEVQR